MTTRTKSIFCVALATGLAAALLQWIMLRGGLYCNPDGWSYWQGSVTLAEGAGYRLFSGEAIVDWPPLYSWYLAMWQAGFGISGATLQLSTICSTGMAAAAWIAALLSLVQKPIDASAAWPAVFVAVLMAQATRHLMSESLANMLLPGLVAATLHAATSTTTRRHLALATVAGAFGGLLMLTRHASVAYLCGAGILLLGNTAQGWRSRILGTAAFGVTSLAPALIAEAMLPAAATRTIGFAYAKFGPLDYVLQAAKGIGDPLAGSWFGFVAWLFAIRIGLGQGLRSPEQRALRMLLTFGLVALFVLYAMFNLTFINTELRGRMVRYLPLMTAGGVLLLVPRLASRPLRNVLLVLLVAIPTGRTVKHMIKGRAPAASLSDAEALADNFVRPHFTIRLDHHGKAPVEMENGWLLVSPPEFPTHDALIRAHRKGQGKTGN